MKVAGRKIVESTSTPASAGLQGRERRLDVAGHLQRVALGLLLDDEQQAGAAVDDAVADRRLESLDDVRDVRQAAHGGQRGAGSRADARADGHEAQVCRRLDRRRVRDGQPLVGPSMNPPAATDTASRVDVTTSCSVTPLARSRSGSTSTCSCRSRWPQMATLATPGTAISRGRTVQRASVVSSTCDRVVDDIPIFITRLSDDSGDRMTGGLRGGGQRGRDARQTLLHQLSRGNPLGAGLEDQHDRRQPEHGLRPQRR